MAPSLRRDPASEREGPLAVLAHETAARFQDGCWFLRHRRHVALLALRSYRTWFVDATGPERKNFRVHDHRVPAHRQNAKRFLPRLLHLLAPKENGAASCPFRAMRKRKVVVDQWGRARTGPAGYHHRGLRRGWRKLRQPAARGASARQSS
ncbi:hypothetical protein MPLB_2310001 [Mesorhizobium sp. ORS 3324]|nr:hypothetical protein MPLB_2310001 [Mesorhizobium sp. ORS 3324]